VDSRWYRAAAKIGRRVPDKTAPPKKQNINPRIQSIPTTRKYAYGKDQFKIIGRTFRKVPEIGKV
jgi:hypothetical protein